MAKILVDMDSANMISVSPHMYYSIFRWKVGVAHTPPAYG